MAKAAPRIAWPRLSSTSASRPAHRMPEQPQDQIDLARADEPAHQAQREARRHPAAAAIGALHGQHRCASARLISRRPVALAPRSARAGSRSQLAEQAAPLQQIEPADRHGQTRRWPPAAAPQRVLRRWLALRRRAAPRPSSAKMICARVCSVVLTVIAAAAACMGMPRWLSWRTISAGPPIWPAGIRLLADSPTQRASSASRSEMRAPCGEQHADGRGIQHERQQVEQRDPQQAPAGHGQRGEHGREALRDEHADEQQRARRRAARSPPGSSGASTAARAALKTWRKPKYPNASFMLEMRRQPGVHARVRHVLEGERDAPLVLAERRDAVAQRVAVEEHQPAGRNLHRARQRRRRPARACAARSRAGRRIVDHAEQQRIAAARVVGGVVVPADVIARTRVEIQRVGMRIVGR